MGIKMGLHIRIHAAHQNTLVQVDLSETFLSLVLFRHGLCLLPGLIEKNRFFTSYCFLSLVTAEAPHGGKRGAGKCLNFEVV